MFRYIEIIFTRDKNNLKKIITNKESLISKKAWESYRDFYQKKVLILRSRFYLFLLTGRWGAIFVYNLIFYGKIKFNLTN